jgi:large subunit ribosomal protein L7/L12
MTLFKQATSLSQEERNALICDLLSNMKVREISALVSTVEQTFGVKAQTGGMNSEMIRSALKNREGPDDDDIEVTAFDVRLSNFGDSKIKVIRLMRQVTGLGLREAKNAVDELDFISKDVDRDRADELADDFEALGATVEITPHQDD